MGVRREDMDEAFAEHSFAPIFRSASKCAGQRAGGDLHPDAARRELFHQFIMRLDPGEPLGVRNDRYVARRHDAEEEVAETWWRGVMRRFDQHVATIGERQQMTTAQPCDEIRDDVVISAGYKLEGNVARPQFFLQILNRDPDVGSAVMEETGQDMGRAGQHRHPVRNRGARHCDSGFEIPCAIVDTRQNMTVKIDHHAGKVAPVSCPSWAATY